MNIKTEVGDASMSQGTPEIVSNPPEAMREVWNRFSFTAFRGNQPYLLLILDFYPPELRQ